jgi:anti-sigma factor RsiW
MACNPEEILLYIDGELSAEDAARVRAHTAVCSACREALLTEQALDSAFGGLKDLEPPPGFAAATVRRAQCDVTHAVRSHGEWRRALAISAVLALLTAALLTPTGIFDSVLSSLSPLRCMARFAFGWVESSVLSIFIVSRTLSRNFFHAASLPVGGVVLVLAVLVALLAWLIAGYRRQMAAEAHRREETR